MQSSSFILGKTIDDAQSCEALNKIIGKCSPAISYWGVKQVTLKGQTVSFDRVVYKIRDLVITRGLYQDCIKLAIHQMKNWEDRMFKLAKEKSLITLIAYIVREGLNWLPDHLWGFSNVCSRIEHQKEELA